MDIRKGRGGDFRGIIFDSTLILSTFTSGKCLFLGGCASCWRVVYFIVCEVCMLKEHGRVFCFFVKIEM